MGMDVRSLQDVINGARVQDKQKYSHWVRIEQDLIESGKSPSLSAYILCEYQFGKRSSRDLSKEFGGHQCALLKLIRKLRIPLRTRSEAGRGELNSIYGTQLSEETRKRMSVVHKGKFHSKETRRKMSESRNNLPEEIKLMALKGSRENRFYFGGIFYDSKTEAACAAMFEKYVPGFMIKEGETFQVNGDTHCVFDFNLENVLVEWHPIIIKHDAIKGDYRAFKELLKEIKIQKKKREFARWFKDELAVDYWMQRQDASDKSQTYKGKEVVLARTPDELYDLVIRKYGQNVPSEQQFCRDFYDVVKQVKPVEKKKVLPAGSTTAAG
jgi:hypothetical protein